MTWLLVEDDTDIRNVVAVMITVWGETPLPFADGNAAWAWLDSVANGTFKGALPDFALMDIRMPGHTGDKIAARIRATAAIKDIPIVLMTAFSLSDAEIKTMMQECGVDELIGKPLPDMDIFRSTLFRVRDQRRTMLKNRAAASSMTPNSAPSSIPSAAPAAIEPPTGAPKTPPTTPETVATTNPVTKPEASAAPKTPPVAPTGSN